MKFDPMTGEPILQEEAKNPAQEVLEQHKKDLKKKIVITITGIVVVVLIVVAVVFGGLFQSKQMKIMKAVANTIADQGKLAKACAPLELIGTDAFTLYLNADVEGQEIEATLASKNNEMQLSGRVDISGMPDIEGIIGLDSKEVRAKLDGLDTVMVYKFTEENKGDLIEEIPEETIELINESLVMLTSDKAQGDVAKKAFSAVLEVVNEWEIENADKKSFEVDGKKRNCTGYTFSVDEDDMEDIADAVIEALDSEISDDVLDICEELMSNAYEAMADTDVTVYIYKDMLAAIILEIGKEEVQIFFEGGAYRMQNVIIEADGYTVMELVGETNGSVEEYEFELGGREILSIEFDEKTGELSLEERYTGVNITIEATLISKSNELSFVLEELDNDYYDLDCELEINLKKGASLERIKGEEFDLGAADEDEFEDLAEDLIDVLY